MIKKFFITTFVVFLTFTIGYVGFIQYIKINTVKMLKQLESEKCKISFSSISTQYSLSRLIYKIHNPNIICDTNLQTQEIDGYTKTKEIELSFHPLKNNIHIKLPHKIKTNINNETLSCTGFDGFDVAFSKNILSVSRDIKSLGTSLLELTYDHDNIRCTNDKNKESLHKMNLNLQIHRTEDKLDHVKFITHNQHKALVENATNNKFNLEFQFVNQEKSIDIKSFEFEYDNFRSTATGKLTLKMLAPYIAGRLAINVYNYKDIYVELAQNEKYKGLFQLIQQSANEIDDDKISLIIQSIGDDLYIGKLKNNDFVSAYLKSPYQNNFEANVQK